MPEMMAAIENHQVYVNKTMNEEYPLMASAIYRSGKPIELIMLWGFHSRVCLFTSATC